MGFIGYQCNCSHGVIGTMTLKVRSYGAIFFFAFAMRKMDCAGVNEGVHTVRFPMCAMHWCVRRCKQLGCIPILCDCDV